MRLLVFGASGPLGRAITEAALAAGHQVTAFVRTPGRLGGHPALSEMTGDVLDAESVAAAVPGHDAVISALGHSRPSPAGHDLPPAPRTSSPR
jgi:putative NADH-flavin reductase